jgi:hypothetical protein
LFLLDYRFLSDWKTMIKGRYVSPAVAFFTLEERGDEGAKNIVLKPLAISLVSPWNLWWTPEVQGKDEFEQQCFRNGWLLAKMHVATADALYHEFGPHLTCTHLITETIMIATYQAFQPNHFIFKLLSPHFQGLATINFGGILVLLEPGNIVDQVMSSGRIGGIKMMQREFKDWTLLTSAPLEVGMITRGVDTASFPVSSYPYRDDGLLFYGVIKKFIEGYIDENYLDDTKLAQDPYLKKWWSYLTSSGDLAEGLPSLNADGAKRFPDFPKTRRDLSDTLTAIIWNASAQHAAVNNGQFHFNAFIPNAPLHLRQPPPTEPLQVSDEYVKASLPGMEESAEQIGFLSILTTDELMYYDTFLPTKNLPSNISHFQYLLGRYNLADGDKGSKAVENFSTDLFDLEKEIRTKQKERIVAYRNCFRPQTPLIPLTVEYPYLLPSETNFSITN